MLFALALMGLMAGTAFAASSDTITVNYVVSAINELNIDGASVTLTVDTATAGAQPDAADEAANTTWDITTNCATNAKKIAASLNSDMPAGLTLTITMVAPSGGSTGCSGTDISGAATTAVDVVTGLETVAAANVAMNLDLSATVSAAVVSANKTLTLTIVNS